MQNALRYRFGGKEIAGQKVGASVSQSGSVSVPAGTLAAAAGRPYLDFGARLYDPRTAAWLSQDPMAEKYYGISPYAYCAGNPVNLVDPDGMWIYIYDGGTQYRFFEGILQKYAGLDDNGEEIYALVECSDPRFSVVYEPSRLISTSGESLYFPGQSYIPFILRFP